MRKSYNLNTCLNIIIDYNDIFFKFNDFWRLDMNKKAINWWNLIKQISIDKSTWDYLEPAEIVEVLQRITEAKEKITGLDRYIHIHLSPALQKLQYL